MLTSIRLLSSENSKFTVMIRVSYNNQYRLESICQLEFDFWVLEGTKLSVGLDQNSKASEEWKEAPFVVELR